jgi:hypothetical protein
MNDPCSDLTGPYLIIKIGLCQEVNKRKPALKNGTNPLGEQR